MAYSYLNQTEYKSKKSGFFIAAVFALLAVLITSTVLCLRLGLYSVREKDADTEISAAFAPASYSQGSVKPSGEPSIDVRDEVGSWDNEEEISLFCVSYKNGKGDVTVKGKHNQKTVAPGTENKYVFNIVNTSTETLAYDAEISSEFYHASQLEVPIEVRIKDHNGNYCMGTAEQWVNISELNKFAQNITLKKNTYEQYTLEWRWPFESGNDAYDTMLGGTRFDVADELEFNVTVKVEAELARDDSQGSGVPIIGIPITGSDADFKLCLIIAALSFVLFVAALLFAKYEEKKNERKKHEAQ